MISSSANRIIYLGNGSTTQFTYTFKIFDASNIKLMRIHVDGTKENVTSDYYVDTIAGKVYYPGYAPGAEEPGQNTPPVLQTGEKLVVYRNVPITQEDDMPAQWPFDVIENMADKGTVIDQQLADGVSRSLRIDVDMAYAFNPILPVAPGYGWRVSDDGTRIVPLSNPEAVYNQTVQIKNETQAIKNETQAIKNETQAIKEQTQAIKTQAVAETTAIKNEAIAARNAAQTYAGNASSYANLAQAWAESNSAPGDFGSKSSKSWAEISQDNATEAAAYAAQCEALAAQALVYDPTVTYEPADVVMVASGDVYRCVAESTGEDPTTSSKWVLVSFVTTDTFELDANGDLMPLTVPHSSSQWDIDGNGDIMPAAV